MCIIPCPSFYQSSKKMDEELIYNCDGILSAVITFALMLKKNEERSIFGLKFG